MTAPTTLRSPGWAPFPAPASRPPLLSLVPPPAEGPAGQEPLPSADAEQFACPSDGVDPEAGQAASAIARVLAEVIAGRRPVSQVRPALVPRVAHLLDHLVRSGAGDGMRLAGLRLQSPREGVVEATARLASPRRSSAFALRIERRPRRWAVTVLEAALDREGRVPARS